MLRLLGESADRPANVHDHPNSVLHHPNERLGMVADGRLHLIPRAPGDSRVGMALQIVAHFASHLHAPTGGRLPVVTDWAAWHASYDDPHSPLAHRLQEVRRQVTAGLDRASAGRVRLLSLCAGRGLDVLPLLASHPRGRNVTGRLVELDGSNVAAARDHAPRGVEVLEGDAGMTDACAGAVPADLLLLCGIFGNVADDDVRRTAHAVPQLCAAGATVVWTRSTHAPDLTPRVRAWFAEAGVVETSFVAEQPGGWSVGAGTFAGEPEPLCPGVRLFTFTTRPL